MSGQGVHRTLLSSRLAAARAFVALALCLWVLVPSLVTAGPAGAATRCGGGGDGMIRVAIVVDFGTVPGGARGTTADCLVLPTGSTGADLLRERAALHGTRKPGFGASGLMCSVDGYPSSGCGDMTPDGYLYWAYWVGTSGTWVYGGGNPFTRRLRDGDIEGWRFTLGSAKPTDPPPGVSPDRRALFPVEQPVSTTVVPTTAPSGGSSTGTPLGGGGGHRDPTPPAAPDPGGDGTEAVPAAGEGQGAPVSGADGDVASDGVDQNTREGEGPGPSMDGDPSGRSADVGAGESAAPSVDEASGATTMNRVAGSVIAAVVVAGLGTAAFLRSRRDRRP